VSDWEQAKERLRAALSDDYGPLPIKTFDLKVEVLGSDLAALLAHTDEAEWLPIDQAPKDGRSILAYVPGFGMGQMVLFWSGGYWREPAQALRLTQEPTYWMPLPSPPKDNPDGR